MSRHFGISFYRPNDHYMRGPGPACAQNARNILKSNARPASPLTAPAGDAGPPLASSSAVEQDAVNVLVAGSNPALPANRFVLSHAEFLADIRSGSETMQNLRTTAFSFLALGLVALPFFLAAVVYALFFAPSVASVF